jgi:hypothetical protein
MMKTGPKFMTYGILMLALTISVASCSKKEETKAPSTPPAPTAQAPSAQAPGASPTQAAPAPQPDAALVKTSPADAYVISADPELKGRLGRLVVVFPEGANTGGSHVEIYKAGETASLAGGYGNQKLDLLPGTYAVVISGKRIEGVPVQSAHDTKMKVGVLRVTAGSGTHIEVLDPSTQKELTSGYGNQVFGLPIGTVHVRIAGQSEAVTIQDGKITDF